MLIDGLTSAVIPADDRGLAYGDGLFETIRLHKGKLVWLEAHLERLQQGCKVLSLEYDFSSIRRWLLQEAASTDTDAVLKLMLTRGSGGRGYKPPEQARGRCIISLHSLPVYPAPGPASGIKSFICRQRLSHQPVLAGVKHLNRLEQVLASMEFPDSSYQEGLMTDHAGNMIEGTRSNLFVSLHGRLLTPGLALCGINGVLRRHLLDYFGAGLQVTAIDIQGLLAADEIFVGNSVVGIWPVTRLLHAGEIHEYAPGPYSRAAQAFFNQALLS